MASPAGLSERCQIVCAVFSFLLRVTLCGCGCGYVSVPVPVNVYVRVCRCVRNREQQGGAQQRERGPERSRVCVEYWFVEFPHNEPEKETSSLAWFHKLTRAHIRTRTHTRTNISQTNFTCWAEIVGSCVCSVWCAAEINSTNFSESARRRVTPFDVCSVRGCRFALVYWVCFLSRHISLLYLYIKKTAQFVAAGWRLSIWICTFYIHTSLLHLYIK